MFKNIMKLEVIQKKIQDAIALDFSLLEELRTLCSALPLLTKMVSADTHDCSCMLFLCYMFFFSRIISNLFHVFILKTFSASSDCHHTAYTIISPLLKKFDSYVWLESVLEFTSFLLLFFL